MKLSRDNDSKIRVTKEEKKAFDQMEKTQIIKNENIENELDKTYQNRQKMLGFTGEAQKSFQEQDDLDIKYSIQTQKKHTSNNTQLGDF